MALTKVSTPAIKDEAITLAKLLHGDANSDGKFLRANNGADPSFETVTSTTINNNADNRVITGSGTANTLNGESGLTYSSNELTVTEQITVDSPDNVTSFAGDYALKLQGGDTINDVVNIRFATDADGSLAQVSALAEATGGYPNSSGSLILSVQAGGAAYEGLRINSARNIGIGIASPAKKLHVFESGEARIRLETGDSRGQAFDLLSTNGAGTNTGTLSIRNESNQSFIDFSHNGGSPFTKIYNTGSQQFTFDSDGLKFGSDTAAANALDDYEEGTYTPAALSGGVGNNTDGQYTKIGNFCIVTGSINFNQTGSGMVAFTLPFTSASGRSGSGVIRYSTLGAADEITMHVNTGNAHVSFYKFGGGSFTYSEAQNHRFDFTITYRTT